MSSSECTKILYFTCVPLATEANGGSLVCREHVRRLAASKGVVLDVCTVCAGEWQLANDFVSGVGAGYHPIMHRAPALASMWGKLFCPARYWPFLHEPHAIDQPVIGEEFRALVDRLKPDIIVIDYLMSVLYVPSVFSAPVRIITITLNREAEFHGAMRRAGRLPPDVSRSPIAQWRLARFEQSVYRNSDAVIVLSKGDLPVGLGDHVRMATIEPALNESSVHWRYSANRQLFFVGNIAHYPNFLAVQWLAEEFAPALEQCCPDARIRIVGAAPEQVRPEWRHKNVDYLGISTPDDVTKLYIESDLFIAPIQNNFGSKIKILQCLANGTPLIATRGALSGIPFENVIPEFSLNDPDGAAMVAADLITNETRLGSLSRMLRSEHDVLRKSREELWRELIAQVKAMPLKSRSPIQRWACNNFVDLRRHWPRRVEVGVLEPDGVTTSGMHPVERRDGSRLRWTTGTSEIKVTLIRKTLPRWISVKLWPIAPKNGTDFRIFACGAELCRGRVHRKRFAKILRLPDLPDAPGFVIRIESSTFQPAGDARELGVAIKSISLVR